MITENIQKITYNVTMNRSINKFNTTIIEIVFLKMYFTLSKKKYICYLCHLPKIFHICSFYLSSVINITYIDQICLNAESVSLSFGIYVVSLIQICAQVKCESMTNDTYLIDCVPITKEMINKIKRHSSSRVFLRRSPT